MNWIKSVFGYRKDEPAALDQYEQHRKFKANGELYVPAKNKEGKSCLFVECDLFFEVGDNTSSHAVWIANLLYDPDQENIEEIIIPITKELEFAGYTGRNMDDEEIRGYSFYNKESNYLFQFLAGKDQEADALEYYMAQLLFEAKTGKSFQSATKTELRELCLERDEKSALTLPIIKEKPKVPEEKKAEVEDVTRQLEKLEIKGSSVVEPPAKPQEPIPIRFPVALSTVLWTGKAPLYKYNPESNTNIMIEKISNIFILELEEKGNYAIVAELGDGSRIETKLPHPDAVKFVEAKNMTLWLTEDESEVYLFNVPPQEKSSLLKCLAKIKGEPIAPPAMKVEEQKHETKVGIPKRFIVTSSNIRAQTTGIFYTLDAETNKNVLLDSNSTLSIICIDESQFRYAIVVEMSNGKRLETEIVEYQHITITTKESYLIWLTEDEKDVYIFSFAPKDRENLIKTLSICKYQSSAKITMSQAVEDPADKSWVENYYNPVPASGLEEMKDIESQDEFQENFEEEAKSVVVGQEKVPKKAPFTDCVQGMSNDRTFVVMGNNIIVYKPHREIPNSLEYLAALPVVSTYQGEGYVPKNPILYASESSLLMTDPDKASIYRMDLEKGKVVEEYKTGMDIRQITQINKNAQIQDEKEFLGISDKGYYRFDTRIGKADKCVSKKEYKKNPQFTCIKANLMGGIAIGSLNGEIRLYKNAGAPRASTLLPGFGDPIIGIDVSLDGKWVLATCPKYLILIPTGTGADAKTGFDKPLGKDKRNPVRLALDPIDVRKFGLGKATFTYATFNNGSALGIEEAIVTGIGEYTVLWNFAKVKKGKLNHYIIKKADSNIVLNQFRFNQPGDVLVTMPESLKIEKRARLQKEERRK